MDNHLATFGIKEEKIKTLHYSYIMQPVVSLIENGKMEIAHDTTQILNIEINLYEASPI